MSLFFAFVWSVRRPELVLGWPGMTLAEVLRSWLDSSISSWAILSIDTFPPGDFAIYILLSGVKTS